MKKYTLVSLLALSCVPGAAFASETPIKVYVGANVASNTITWDKSIDAVEDYLGLELPEFNLGLGVQVGVKYAPQQIYNLGLTLNYDYMFNSSAEISKESKPYISDATTGFSAIGFTFDNYIRFAYDNNRRSDLMLGIGWSNVTERMELSPTTLGYSYGLEHAEGSDDGGAFVLKVGYNQELTDHIDFLADVRLFITNGDIDNICNISAGIRYNF